MSTQQPKKKRGGVLYPFPGRLHKLLQDSECDPALACLISWNEDGTAFHVHDKKTFEREIQPTYFDQSKYASFRRQLNLWSFQRISNPGFTGLEGFYTHPLFKRNEPQLCEKIQRSGATPAATGASNAKKCSKGKNEEAHGTVDVKEKKSLSHPPPHPPLLDTGEGKPQESTRISSASYTPVSSTSNKNIGLMQFQGFPINSNTNGSVNIASQQKSLSKLHPPAPTLDQDFTFKMGQLKSKEIYLRALLEETKRQQEEEKKKVRKVSSADDLLGLYHSLCNQQRQTRRKNEEEVQTKHPHQIHDMTQSRFLNHNNTSRNFAGKTHDLRRGRLSCNISKRDADYLLLLLEDEDDEM